MNWSLIDSEERIIIDNQGASQIVKIVYIQAKTVEDIPEPLENWAVGSICFVENPHKWFTLGIEGGWI